MDRYIKGVSMKNNSKISESLAQISIASLRIEVSELTAKLYEADRQIAKLRTENKALIEINEKLRSDNESLIEQIGGVE